MTTDPDEPGGLPSYAQAATLALLSTAGGVAGGLVAGPSGSVVGAAVGGVLASLVAQHQTNGQDKALRTLELAGLGDPDAWLADPERAELLMRAARAGFESSTEDRIRALAAVLRAVDTDQARVDEALIIVGCLAQLDAPHIRAMRVMEDESGLVLEVPEDAPQTPLRKGWSADDPAWAMAGLDALVVAPVLRRLEANGLVYDALHGAFGGGPVTYRLTATARACLDYLRAVPETDEDPATGS